ncbi:1-phosphatidylinositol 4,5-bisphosphate phosphodiesterase gamma-1-like [Oppia nitens]|uniref:1-phosphatidylinositol 4,5-bisphosphate phosphodiesterase gamma-1-like n=1 Tax=Oppia nitens TaxID=1686743 RepID=UPI0023DA6B4F|nr:1-phosphatidylinositol 4,5-bisphosphate phosphodiesterase gamma-1-like [Oppia nitens]
MRSKISETNETNNSNDQMVSNNQNEEKRETNVETDVKLSEEDKRANYDIFGSIKPLLVPITLSMILVIVYIKLVHKDSTGKSIESSKNRPPIDSYYLMTMIIIILIITTFLLVLFVWLRCYKVIFCWLFISISLILTILSSKIFGEIVYAMNIPFDLITSYLFLWNYVIIGVICIFWMGPEILQKFFLIMNSCMTSVVILFILYGWPVWILLGVLVIWDIVAVLCPFGPLRLLIKTLETQKKKDGKPMTFPPGLLYSTVITSVFNSVYILAVADKDNNIQSVGNKETEIKPMDTSIKEGNKSNNETKTKNRPKLGLGDFVFYSVLMGMASTYSDFNLLIACYLAIIVGLGLTLICLTILKIPLPALPISITLGIIIFKLSENGIPNDLLKKLEYGFVFNRLEPKSRCERRLFCVQLDLFRVIWISGSNNIEGVINMKDIQEVRIGTNLKSDNKSDESKNHFFAIYYGKKFRLKEMICFANTLNDIELWFQGIKFLRQTQLRAPYHSRIDVMLRREFTEFSRNQCNNNIVYLKDMKAFLAKIHFKLNNEELKKRFHEVDKAFVNQLDFEGFSTFFLNLMNTDSNKFLSEHIGQYCCDGKRVTLQEFVNFLRKEQNIQDMSESVASDIIKEYLLDPLRHYEIDPYFAINEFIDYLFSKQNSIFDPKYETVYQDMSHPLSYYFIATSHNTYLSGDQFKSESSVECYARSLQMGCRCIELDCWDGPDGKPLIYHGMTLTSRIRFIDVITTIKRHAFTSSQYPLILSIENHCSLKQQQYMASAFREVFGDLLLTQQVDANEEIMPSPNQLKCKIIHKKLTKSIDDKPLNSPKEESNSDIDLDISNSIKNGILYIEDPNEKKWKLQYFVLTRDKLYYVEPKAEDEREDLEEEEDTIYGTRDSVQFYEDSAYELHFGETWFHGKLKGGRGEAKSLLQKYLDVDNNDGTFLVRDCESNPSDYSLSFIYQNNIHHSRIFHNIENNQKIYKLNKWVPFTSLYELITHYQTHPLRSQKFNQLFLTTPVPPPNSHEDKEWFYKNMTRSYAEDMLRRLRNDGAYLVRPSEKSHSEEDNLFAISFRAENKIKHCRIRREGRLYVIGSAEFGSLTELIEYYEKNPLYRKVKLKFPVTEENIRILGGEPDLESQSNYTNPKGSTIKVMACYDYQAKNDEELSFSTGDIITNVVKQDHGWWRGDLKVDGITRIGCYFPSNFVEEIEDDLEVKTFDSNKLSLDLKHGFIELDSTTLISNIQNKSREWVFRLGSLDISAQNEDELKDWINKIQETIQLNKVKQLSRVYPKGSRLDSSNYDPTRMWNCGLQLVALNYQTPDKAMQLNEAMFMQNGRCGYVLKPQYMFEDNFNPYEKPTDFHNFNPIVLTVRVISARNLRKALKGIVSPSIEIEIIGVDYDCRKCMTRVVQDNGLNPIWSSETFVFNITCPQLAFIRFLVCHLDTFDDSSFVGHSTLPITCLRTGYRSIQLKNEYSEELELSTLLIHIDIRKANENNIKASVDMLRHVSENLCKMIYESEKSGNEEEAKKHKSILQKVEEQLKNKTSDSKRFISLELNNRHDFKLINELSIVNKVRKTRVDSK